MVGLLVVATLAIGGPGEVWISQPAQSPLPIVRGDAWKYFKGTLEPPVSWNTAGFDDSGWSSGPSGIGYGDGDDATILSDMQNGYTTVYTRRLFDVANPQELQGLEMKVDYDDGFVAYLNGVEVARRNVPAGVPAYNAVASSSHEASGGTNGNAPETISLNAHLGQLVPGTNVLAVQAVNVSPGSSDLSLIVELRATNAPPAAPTNPSPASGSTGVALNPTLCVDVSDPDGGTLTATFSGREVTGAPADDFTIIALPDTQYYSASFPATYAAQTQWIVDHRVERNIVYVTELGDCADNATINQQYVNADAAWDIIEANPYTGQPFGLPFGIAVGNHDQAPNADPGTLADEGATTAAFNSWFGAPRFNGRGYYGGHYGANNDNHFDLFSASGMDFLAIHIEYMASDSPLRQAVLAWADGVLKAYPSRRAIVISHYTLETGTSTAFSNQAQAIYDALKGNSNLFLMMGGHLDQASRRSDTYNGHTIHTLKSDYQTRPNGGNGWLRILTFSPAGGTIHVETYSPTLGQFINTHADNTAGTAQNDFVLPYEMTGGTPFVTLGSDSVPGGGTACVSWPLRQPGRQYEWNVSVSDGTDTTPGGPYLFTTALNCTFDSDCADGNLCNGIESCSGGTCQAGSTPDCNDASACTADACDPVSGCSNVPITCNDNDPCTTDSCDALSGCLHQAVSCPQGQVCNAQTGVCEEPATACSASAECADADPCTTDVCVGGNVSALVFDGANDFVTFGAAPGLNSAQFTVETWFKRTGTGIGNTTGASGIASLVPLVTKGAPEADGSNVDANYVLGINTAGDVLAADFEDTATGLNHPVSGTTTISSGVWHHAAASYDGTTWRLYLDGVPETTLAVGAFTPRADSIQHAGLGAMLTSTGTRLGAFQGLLDEVRIWDHARTPAEIQAAMGLEIASGTGLLGRWGLNENGGSVVGDSTTPAENGALTNGPVWSASDRAPLVSGSCSHTPIPGCRPCNGNEECLDADQCNGAETCTGGICQPGTALNCDDADACTIDTCDPTDGCQHAALTCDDGVACTADSCDPGLGCQHLSACAPGTMCDAGSGLCVSRCAAAADCNDSDACTTDTCNGGNAFALQLNGTTQYVSMGAAPGLNAAAFTLETWFRRTGAGTATSTGTNGIAALVPLVAKGAAQAEGSNVDANYILGINTAGNVLAADFEEGPGGPGPLGQNHPISGTTAIVDNVWYHAAATYDGATWRLYLNGLPEATLAVNAPPRSDSIQHFGLGTTLSSSGAASGFLAGELEEVRIWNRALSQAEIQANMDLPLTAGTGLIGRWGFEDGLTATDSTTPAENGTLFNTPIFDGVNKPPLQAGTCNHTAVSCSDGNLCTTDSCNAATGCAFTPVTCSDGDACNGLETCDPGTGACVGGTPPTCDDGNPCTVDGCSGGGCVHVAGNDGAACDDGSACTSGDVCSGGICAGAADTALCNDGNSCTADTCASAPAQGGLSFDGTNDYVTFGAAAELGNPQFTVETWFKRTGTGIGNTTGGSGIPSLVPLVTKGAPEADGSNVDANYILGINTAGNVLAADFEDTATGLNHPVSGTTAITNDVWHHAAATYDGTTWRLYLDGAPEATLTVGAFTPRADSIQHAGLGAMLTSTGTRLGAFQGLLDEVRIWNRARTQAEILDGKNRRFTSMPGLVGRWGLDEGSGGIAADSTSPSSNGTLTNMDLGTAWVAGAPAMSAVLCSSAVLPDGSVCTADANACTADACNAGTCMATYSPTPGCCVADENCDDGNTATIDACAGGSCANSAPVSCTAGAQCDDSNACTTDSCEGGNISALNFSGTTDYVTMGAAAGETALGARAFTLEAWIRRDGTTWGATTSTGTGGVTAVPLVTKGRGEAEGSNVDCNYFLGITAAGRPVADFEQFALAGGWSAGQNHPACSSIVITDQAWHHVAVTYSAAAGWKFYVDGVEGTTADGTSCTTCSPAGSCPQSPGVEPRYDSIQHFGLGTAMTSAGAAAGFYAGVLDEVRVWNRALTGAEIAAGKDQEIAAAANLIGRWSLNENSGTTAGDSAAPAQNGTLTNAPLWTTDRAPIAPGTCRYVAGNSGAVCRASAGACDLPETCTGTSAFCPADLKQPNGTACNDGDACTQTDTCRSGACAGANPVVCAAADTCHDPGACNPATGACSNPPKADGAPCEDGGICTTNDTCQSGACVAGPPAPNPGEISNLLFGPDGSTLTWDALPAAILPVTYDVTRGLVGQPPLGGGAGAACVDTSAGTPQTSDPAAPPDGEVWWYLVRGRHACGAGTWGWGGSEGNPTTERQVDACP
jgi:concanavalin A-like lectin/glucanase superfamily protein/slime mold repeat-containing protein